MNRNTFWTAAVTAAIVLLLVWACPLELALLGQGANWALGLAGYVPAASVEAPPLTVDPRITDRPPAAGWCDPSAIHPIAEGELDPTVGLTLPAAGETHIEWYVPNQKPDEGIIRVLPGQAVTVQPGVRGHYWTFAAGVRPACMQADWELGLANYLAKPQHHGLVAADVVIFPKGDLITVTP